jgi:hypothetical protein
MRVAELRTILSHLQQIYVASGAKGPAKDLQVIADVLRSHAEADLSSFIMDLSERLSRGKEKPKARQKAASSGKAASQPDEGQIIFHVARLQEAGTLQSRFEDAFERLKADRSLKLAELSEIARRYSNSVTKYRSLGAAHKDISQAFIRRARFENKLQ